MKGWSIFGPAIQGRACGGCGFCCTTVPVRAVPLLDKAGGVKCQHRRSTGCSIYSSRPDPCAAWNCTWLYQPAASGLKRPDIGGYAVDPMPQQILLNGEPIHVVQVWCDPARRDAHRAPELRAYLDVIGRDTRMPAIVRWPNGQPQEDQEATVLFAPSLTGGDWWEQSSAMLSEAVMAGKLSEANAL